MQNSGLQPPVQGAPQPFEGQDDMFGMESDEEASQDFGDNFKRDFDAGVEADEDEDPENYIRQLTGKLSQKLNSFVSQNGNDESLTKYAAKMVIKAAADGMSDQGKKELIQSVNTSDSNDEVSDDEDMNDSQDDSFDMEGGQEDTNLNEICISKKKLRENMLSMNPLFGDEENERSYEETDNSERHSVFSGKRFKS